MDWIIILIVAPFLIGFAGEIVKKWVNAKAGDPGFKGLYYVTYKGHALVVGALLGLAMWAGKGPVPALFHYAVGDVSEAGIGGYVLAYAFSGGVAMVAYSTIVGTIKNSIEHLRIGKSG
jgi:hypothetical protein